MRYSNYLIFYTLSKYSNFVHLGEKSDLMYKYSKIILICRYKL